MAQLASIKVYKLNKFVEFNAFITSKSYTKHSLMYGIISSHQPGLLTFETTV